jgi:hypothetical protein
MANLRTALLASAASALSLAATPGALANNLLFTDSDPSNEIRRDVIGIYASGSNLYAATYGAGLRISTNAGSIWINCTRRDVAGMQPGL